MSFAVSVAVVTTAQTQPHLFLPHYHLPCSGYSFGPINESKLLRRVVFLETVAGIPGMVAGALRHLGSLRNMKRDHGYATRATVRVVGVASTVLDCKATVKWCLKYFMTETYY